MISKTLSRPVLKECIVHSFQATLLSVPVGSLVVGLLLGVALAVQEGSARALPDTLFVGGLVAIGGMLVALLPALTYGVFVHAFLLARQRATYFTSLLVGVLPALCLVPFDTNGAILVGSFGSVIAMMTHWIAVSSKQSATG
jgi:hypothetical protein